MNSRLSNPLLVAMALPLLVFGAALGLVDKATAPLIEYAADDLTRPHGCTEMIRFPTVNVLQGMGHRSVPILRRHLADPSQGVGSKMLLADQLCQLGDNASFQVFINALSSSELRHRSTAAWRMQKYPALCAQHVPAILKAGRLQQSNQYRELLFTMAGKSHLPDDKKDALMEIILDIEWQYRGATPKQIAQLQRQFGLQEGCAIIG